MLLDGRNQKIKPLGFDTAATVLTAKFSPEAATNFTRMVKDVAGQYGGYNDSKAVRRLRARLKTVARRQDWASEVLTHLANARSEGAAV